MVGCFALGEVGVANEITLCAASDAATFEDLPNLLLLLRLSGTQFC